MALTRTLVLFTYKSSYGGVDYYFDISIDENDLVEVRNIRGPLGLIQDVVTGVPESVTDDILEARDTAVQQIAETQVTSGNVSFAGVTSMAVVIAGGLLNNTNYRVVYTTPDGIILRTESKTTTGFTAVAPSTYGTVGTPIVVPYVVLVAAQLASTTSGVLTFAAADAGSKTVTFAAAMATADYRVVLTPDDFFTAKVINKTKAGFTVQINFTVAAAQTETVGYDVFVG